MPRYETEGAAGLDLSVVLSKSEVLAPGAKQIFDTGWAFEIPSGFEGQVRPRSGLARRGLVAVLGTIDSDYRGEVSVLVHNITGHNIEVRPGDRVAQLVIAPVAITRLQEVDLLTITERGEGGFGSTGVGRRE